MSPALPAILTAALVLGGASPARAMTLAKRCALAATQGNNVEVCRAALKQNPRDVGILRSLARAQIETGSFEDAVKTYERVVALSPEDAKAHEDLAGTLGFIRQYERAAREMERALSLRPARAADFRTLAIMYVFLNNPGRAVEMNHRAAELGDPIAMYDLRQFYRDGFGVSKDLDTALAWTERAAQAGHLGAMALLTDIYLEGLYGQTADEAKALHWAQRLHAAEHAD